MKAKTIGQVAKSSGVSERTLRYYEELGILMPERTAAGYRVYREADERRLAQIMAMRRCGLPLTTIGHLVKDPAADIHAPLGPIFAHCARKGNPLRPPRKGHWRLLNRWKGSRV
ncbi:DNA-binding transcriptional MerR regulator [Parvibacter caecicola]|uniref:DNA-binding transcriptional MerR regulator n=1 Tax=Parvibacter caecicola TaxID=747645 RepID=A0A7W5D246_9ACTN|nr:MerR family transcriptional regulator [Parvibacter caecicola]MBB3171489.1 DNA-binding transcriptional MerR regulator [Parvibacter caecicola]